EVFGFKADPEPQKIGPALGGLLELENLDLTIHFLHKQGVRLELLHYTSPAATGDGTRRPLNQLGLSHLAFQVTNIDAMINAVAHMGGTVLKNTRLEAGGSTRAIFVTDPDGTRIELIAA
ncbi:MAG: VOC family protein, partial [Rhodospirillaceae bacterium]